MEDAGEKTEQPTLRKREEARERGQVARSVDLSTAIILLAAMLAFYFSGDSLWNGLSGLTRQVLSHLHTAHISQQNIISAMSSGILNVIWILLPFLVSVTVAAFLINVAQVGLVFSGQPLVPDITKLDPLKGLKRIYSMRSAVKTIVSLLKLTFISTVVYLTLREDVSSLFRLTDQSVNTIFLYAAELCFKVGLRMCIALLLLAILDYSYQRYQMTKDLMMSKQEVKEEMKRMEGDPRVRDRRRQIQRQLAMQRMMGKVPKADVVITNPTHYAIALQYQPDSMLAPQVVAKGMDLVALRIRQVAEENNVPIHEDPPLARELYKKLDIDDFIPPELFGAVAEVLAFVMRENKSAKEKISGG